MAGGIGVGAGIGIICDFVLIAQFLSKLPDDINCDLLFEKIEALSSATSKRTFPTLSSLW